MGGLGQWNDDQEEEGDGWEMGKVSHHTPHFLLLILLAKNDDEVDSSKV